MLNESKILNLENKIILILITWIISIQAQQ